MMMRFWPVFLTSQLELSRMTMMKAPSTIDSSCVSSTENLKPVMMMLAKAPRPDVGSVVQMAIRQ